jgi:Catalase-related immune-responsive
VTRHETGNEDNFSQCGDFFRNVLTTAEKERLTDNIAGNLIGTYVYMPFTQIEAMLLFRCVKYPTSITVTTANYALFCLTHNKWHDFTTVTEHYLSAAYTELTI